MDSVLRASLMVMPVARDAYAGSSVNVMHGVQSNLVTHAGSQYAGFYGTDRTVVLAKRNVTSGYASASSSWHVVRTGYHGDCWDAHRFIALGVDGAGRLHVAWDHHYTPLNYARALSPGSLELGPREAMLRRLEDRVTYPAFLLLPGGDLLFHYRHGTSKQGDLVLNRYDMATGRWARISLACGDPAKIGPAHEVRPRNVGGLLAHVPSVVEQASTVQGF